MAIFKTVDCHWLHQSLSPNSFKLEGRNGLHHLLPTHQAFFFPFFFFLNGYKDCILRCAVWAVSPHKGNSMKQSRELLQDSFSALSNMGTDEKHYWVTLAQMY